MFTRFGQFSADDDFRIKVNNKWVPTIEQAADAEEYEFRYEGSEDVDGVGRVTWWMGFTESPQPAEELQGIGIYASKRMAVERPFFFNLTKGFTGQLSKEYMTGVVTVEALDEDDDLIASNRGSINWSHPTGVALEEWGQALIRKYAREWDKARGKRKLKNLEPDPKLMALIRKLGPRPRRECETLLRRLAKIPHASKEDIDRTARVLLNGLQQDEFLDTLHAVNESTAEELPQLLNDWQVLEALLFLPVVKSRIEVIRKLDQLIEDEAPEFPDIFSHLKDNPELLRPEWQPLAWNVWMDTIVKEVFDSRPGAEDGQRRPDILCLSDSRHYVIVELKRPGYRVTVDEAQTFLHYLRRIEEEVAKDADSAGAVVEGLLICDRLHPDAKYQIEGHKFAKRRPWRSVLEDAERQHKYILDRTIERVPGDDPRAEPYLERPPRTVKVSKRTAKTAARTKARATRTKKA